MVPVHAYDSDSFTNSENQNECDNKVVIVFYTEMLADGTECHGDGALCRSDHSTIRRLDDGVS